MRVLTKEEVVSKFINDFYKKRYETKNQADCYMWNKARICGIKDAQHKKRQPGYRSK